MQGDVDAGELQHHLLEGVGHGVHVSGYVQQTTDEVHRGCAVAIGQKAIVSDSDKALW
jgi:hypothetical protein